MTAAEKKREAIRLYRSGLSIYAIAPQLECAPQTVHKWLAKAGEPRRTKSEAGDLAVQRLGKWQYRAVPFEEQVATDPRKQKALELYASGQTIYDIAPALGIGKTTVTRWVNRAGLPRHRKTKSFKVSTADTRELAVSCYLDGLSMCQIAKELGVSNPTVKNWLMAAGIQIRSVEERMNLARKHPINHDAFETIQTDAQAYWLGFITADGCLPSKSELRINLQLRDKEHLARLRDFLETTYEIGEVHGFRKLPGSEKPFEYRAAYLDVSSMKLCADLACHGIGPRKSATCCFNRSLSDHLYAAYFRGLFDGDGGWCALVSRASAQWRLCGNREFLLEARRKLEELTHVEPIELYPHHTTKWLAYLIYCKSPQVIHLAGWMYNEATIFLPRKYIQMLDYLSEHHSG